MRYRIGIALAICLLAVSYSGCLKHTPRVPTAQVKAPAAAPPSLSEYIRTVLKISSENTTANDEALLELQKRRPDLAELAQRLTANPNDLDGVRTLAEAYLQEKLYVNAHALFQQLQLRSPEDATPCVGLATIWDAWGDNGLALQYATRSTTLDPKSSRAQEALGRIYMHQKQLDLAMQSFLAALEINSENGPVQAITGYLYILRADWANARPHLERALQIDATLIETRNNLGVVLARLGDNEGALRQFMAVSDTATAHNNLGAVYLSVKDWQKAQQEFQAALTINPTYAKAAQNLRETETHVPPPALYTLKPFPKAPGAPETDWKALVAAAEPQFQPREPISLSDYMAKVFQLEVNAARGVDAIQVAVKEKSLVERGKRASAAPPPARDKSFAEAVKQYHKVTAIAPPLPEPAPVEERGDSGEAANAVLTNAVVSLNEAPAVLHLDASPALPSEPESAQWPVAATPPAAVTPLTVVNLPPFPKATPTVKPAAPARVEPEVKIEMPAASRPAPVAAPPAVIKAAPSPWELARAGQRLLGKGLWEQARQNLESALAIDASIPEARNNLGLALAHLGDREGALRQLFAVSRRADAYYHMGLVYLADKKARDAKREFQNALTEDPEFAEARAGLKEADARLVVRSAYKIQLLAGKNENTVQAEGELLAKKAGVTPSFERADLEQKGTWYRARVGAYETFSEALKAAKKLVVAGLIKGYWIVPPEQWGQKSD